MIAEYDASWPGSFAHLSSGLRENLGALVTRIEHVGSTSVPGLAAKPIIDLDVVIRSADELPRLIERLREIGYLHEGDLGVPGRQAFKRLGIDVPRTSSHSTWPEHHLYVVAEGSRELERHVRFRDFLRGHPTEAEAYACLKRELAAKCDQDREAYTAGKTRFVEEILARRES